MGNASLCVGIPAARGAGLRNQLSWVRIPLGAQCVSSIDRYDRSPYGSETLLHRKLDMCKHEWIKWSTKWRCRICGITSKIRPVR